MFKSIVILTSSFSLAVIVRVLTLFPLAILTKLCDSLASPVSVVRVVGVFKILCSRAKEGKSSESFSMKVYVIAFAFVPLKSAEVVSTTLPRAVGVSEPAKTGGRIEATPFPVL